MSLSHNAVVDSFIRTWALIWKELLTVLKDPRSRLNLILPPVMQILVFGYAATYDLKRVHYVALDGSRSAESRRFLAHLDGSGAFERVADLENATQIAPAIESRRALMAVQIPDDFARRLALGQSAPVQVILDGRNSNTSGTALNYLAAISREFGRDVVASGQAGGGAPFASVTLEHRAWYNPDLETRWNVVPALLALLTLLDVTILASLSVAREREQGTFDQLLVTPLRPLEVMAGKAIPSIVVGLAQASIVLVAALYWFQVPFVGNMGTLYAALLLFLTASVSVGVLVSTLSHSMQQALMGCFVVVMPFALLSGLATPVSAMPEWVKTVTVVNPLRWGIVVVHRLFLEGATLGDVVPELTPLIVIAVVSLAAAAFRFQHRLT